MFREGFANVSRIIREGNGILFLNGTVPSFRSVGPAVTKRALLTDDDDDDGQRVMV